MKKELVKIGGEYAAKVSGKTTRVRILRENSRGGWDGVNVATGRAVRIRTAARLRPLFVNAKTGDRFEFVVPTPAEIDGIRAAAWDRHNAATAEASPAESAEAVQDAPSIFSAREIHGVAESWRVRVGQFRADTMTIGGVFRDGRRDRASGFDWNDVGRKGAAAAFLEAIASKRYASVDVYVFDKQHAKAINVDGWTA